MTHQANKAWQRRHCGFPQILHPAGQVFSFLADDSSLSAWSPSNAGGVAMSWIKVREDLHEDPAVLYMAGKLQTRPEHVVGYCHKFWGWVSRQCHDGVVEGVTLDALEGALCLKGFPQLLVEVGWLEYSENGEKPVLTIPKFERHLSQGAKARALAAERQRRHRTNTPVTKVSRTKRDKIVTREEKIREEKNIKGGTSPLNPLGAALPFDSEAFAEAWKSWVAHRIEKKKPLTPTSLKQQLTDLTEMGEQRAVAALQWSIRNGWTGIFEQETRNAAGQAKLFTVGAGQRYAGN
jgi:hypothetical protein